MSALINQVLPESGSAPPPQPSSSRRARRHHTGTHGRWFWPAAVHLAALAVWWFATTYGGVPRYILPTPQGTLLTLTQASYHWPVHVAVTAAEVFGGYLLAVVVGIALALFASWSRWLALVLMPLLVTLNMIPKIALAPLFIVWLNYGVVPNMVIAFTICFFPIVLTTARGLKEVEPDLIDLVRTVRATRWQIFSKIQLPSALPYIFSGMKVASVLAVAGAVVGEFIGSEKGLGNLMLAVQATMDTEAMFMAVILITLIGVALYGLVVLLEHLLVVRDARLN